MGRDVHSFDVVHPAFPLPTTASSALARALKDGFGEAVVACDTCEFPPLDSCHERFLRAHGEFGLAPHPVVGLVLQVGAAEKFPQESQSQQEGFVLHSHRRGWR